jgi:hypothetical protein
MARLMDKQRNVILDVYCKKGLALLQLLGSSSNDNSTGDDPASNRLKEVSSVLASALLFADLTDARLVKLSIKHAVASGHYARAVKMLWRIQNGDVAGLHDGPSAKETELYVASMFERLGWPHAAKASRLAVPTRFPNAYLPF